MNDKLADLNHHRYQYWQQQDNLVALPAYSGDAFQALKASDSELSDTLLQHVQQHLIIISGLYGAVRPLDGTFDLSSLVQISLRNTKPLSLWCTTIKRSD